MLSKRCSCCKEIKEASDFHKDKKGPLGLGYYCKECANAKMRKWHNEVRTEEQRQTQLDREKAFRETRKTEAISYLGGKCSQCGGVFPSCVYDFHHKDPTEKEGNPSWFLNKRGDRWKAELDKCVLVCSNCHRIIHFGEQK